MIDVIAPLLSGLVAGLVGSLVGGAVVWWSLRGRMDVLAAVSRVPQSDSPSLACLREDVRRLVLQQAAQDEVHIERLHQWQRDLMRFLGDSQKRQTDDFRALLQPATASPLAASTASAPVPIATVVSAAASCPPAPVPRPLPSDAPSFVAVLPARELTDEEIDALPPELPEPTRRKRLAQRAAAPPMRGI
ncbi:MAG: hypothetical protein V4636_17960 [Pseudomonadota bacterium]